MIELIAAEVPKGKGHVIFLTATIGGAITDINNKNQTIVFTDTFPDGIAIDMDIKAFYELWLSCLSVEVEYEFIPDNKDVH